MQSKRIPLPADVNISTFSDDFIQHADIRLSLLLSFINLKTDADGPGNSLTSNLLIPPRLVASSSDKFLSDCLELAGLIDSAVMTLLLFIIALTESIGTPDLGLIAIGMEPTVIAEAMPSFVIKYRVSRVLARKIESGVQPVREGRRVLLIRAKVPDCVSMIHESSLGTMMLALVVF